MGQTIFCIILNWLAIEVLLQTYGFAAYNITNVHLKGMLAFEKLL